MEATMTTAGFTTRDERLDGRDETIIAGRLSRRYEHRSPLVGDVVRFADGTVRAVSYVWPDGVQTSDGGRFYLQPSGDCSFSGSLYTSVPSDSLHYEGRCDFKDMWVFHHDQACASNGVEFLAPVKMWRCDVEAPRC